MRDLHDILTDIRAEADELWDKEHRPLRYVDSKYYTELEDGLAEATSFIKPGYTIGGSSNGRTGDFESSNSSSSLEPSTNDYSEKGPFLD